MEGRCDHATNKCEFDNALIGQYPWITMPCAEGTQCSENTTTASCYAWNPRQLRAQCA
ncbi:hypothetical protein OIDMADRAFT_20939 [Oidiodendron maius Zn]|uniref:Uncharacterized protein n=1 Tax=Oidiodendron maius (strain Zn) TaxID=913774 RepID=A0A0C3GIR7_OIDMZ|nr:hypothetical protein OIDMADRAFT_20939 [Oidiodendron maius Zn]